jgi:hypothetical protein
MKINVLLFVFLLGSYWAAAQIITIPDANFKAKLLSASPTNPTARNAAGTNIRIDTNFNNEIEYSEVLTVHHLNVSYSNITSIEGIQNFINLSSFFCTNNNLIELPVSNLNQLASIDCSFNQLSSVPEIENLIHLSFLFIDNNPLLSLGLNNLSSLINLRCTNSLLSEIDICGTQVQVLWCDNSPNLISLNLKNGIVSPPIFARNSSNTESSLMIPPPLPYFSFYNCPLVSSICHDFGEYNTITEAINYSPSSITFSTLCLTCPPLSIVELKLNVQGFYDTTENRMKSVNNNQLNTNDYSKVTDVSVELRDATGTLIGTTTTDLKTDGTATCVFPNQPTGSFYIGVKTENSVQTWSATPQLIGSTPLNYDFTTSATKAFGSNLIQLNSGVFGLYSGDINNDGNVDNSDYTAWELDSNNFAFGPFATDLNGDGNVDNSDYTVWETNSNVFVYAISPF